MSPSCRRTFGHARSAPVAFLLVTLGFVTTVHADPEATARLDALPCASLDPNAYVDLWRPGQAPYGIPFATWDRPAFDALKARLLACATPANRQRTLTVLRYLDDPYGPTSRVARQQDDQRSAASRTAALTDEIRADLAAVAGESDLVQRRGRLMRVTTKLDTSRLPAETQLQLRAELNRQSSALAAAEAEQAEAHEVAERQRRTAEAQAAEQARQAAARAAAERQASEEQRKAEARQATERQAAQEQAAANAANRYYAERVPRLSPDLITFFDRNPALKPVSARDGLVEAAALVDSYVVALDTCRSTLSGFGAEWTELQRRLGLMQQALLVYYDVPAAELAQITRLWRVRWQNQGLVAQLKADLGVMRQTCSEAVTTTARLLDFTR